MTLQRIGLMTAAVASIAIAIQPASAQQPAGGQAPAWQADGSVRRAGLLDMRNHSVSALHRPGQIMLTEAEAPPMMEGEVTAVPAPGYGPDCGYRPCDVDCCPCFWEHRTGVHFDYIYLKPRNADVQYATPQSGLAAIGVPLGSSHEVDIDYDSGFRVGGAWAIDPCSSFIFDYTWYESNDSDSASLPGGAGFLRADTAHPNALPGIVAPDSLTASADYDIDFQFVDAAYKGVLWGGDCYVLNYVIGLRYANLEQDFNAIYLINGQNNVSAEIDFDGIGPRFGLDGERLVGRGFLVYAKGFASFLAGEFRSDYEQTSIVAAAPVAAAGFDDDRLISLLEMELGVGWQSECGNWRVMAGYYVAAWLNTMTTPDLIQSAQTNQWDQYGNADEHLAFDGLSLRFEYRR